MSVLRLVSSAALALLVAGCAMIPPEPVVTGPTTAAPPPPPSTPAQPTGSIYQPTAYGNYPLFEDRRPRNVGDIVTIVLNERTNASKNVATNTNRSGSANLGIAAAPSFMDSWANANLNTDAKGGNVSQGKGDSTANNAFTGTITTTVVGVMSMATCRSPAKSRSRSTVAASMSVSRAWSIRARSPAPTRYRPRRWPMPASSTAARASWTRSRPWAGCSASS